MRRDTLYLLIGVLVILGILWMIGIQFDIDFNVS